MKQVLGTILHVLLTVFVVITAGFLLLAFVLIINGGKIDLPPLAQNILQGVAILYLADIALLLFYLAVFLVRYVVIAVRQGQGKMLLKSLLVQVPLAIIAGVLIEGVGRLISYGDIGEGGIMYMPIIFVVGILVKNLFPKPPTE